MNDIQPSSEVLPAPVANSEKNAFKTTLSKYFLKMHSARNFSAFLAFDVVFESKL